MPEPAAEDFTQDYYENIYRNYKRQNPPYKLAFYKNILQRYLPSGPVAVLDVGCAFGTFLGTLPREWKRCGIDISAWAIQHGRHQLPGVRLANAVLENSPFQGPFDAITSFDVIEHIPDLQMVAERITGLLKPEGIFVFVVPVYDGPLGWLVHLIDRDPTHVHKQSRRWWLEWAGAHFHIQEWLGTYRFLFKPVYLHVPSRALRAFSPAILVVARKK